MRFTSHLAELAHNKGLLWALTTRELKGRYRGSLFGFLWTFLNPLMLLGVYALVFSVYFRVQMDHYAVFMFTGLLPWVFFSQSLNEGAGAITDGGSLVTKVLFPLQILPAVKVAANFVNYLLSLPILFAFFIADGVAFHWTMFGFLIVATVHLAFTYALAVLLSAANVFLRDTKHIIGNLLTLWFFLTPILYPLAQVPQAFRPLVYLNPAAVITLAYHDVFFWGRWPAWGPLAGVAALSLVLLFVAVVIFENHKEYFAEKI
ncbi:MAG: ABC transporter permease [Desulfarculaceae bacterium]|nr:ABC transporter permease [Desulfarculaceae bacterium]